MGRITNLSHAERWHIAETAYQLLLIGQKSANICTVIRQGQPAVLITMDETKPFKAHVFLL